MERPHFNFEDGAVEEEQKQNAVPFEGKKDIVCRHWLNHECQRGDACTYLHEMDYDKFPECELGAKCNRPGCLLKHPTRDGERECLFYKQGFCPYGKKCRNKHLRYEAGALPLIIDISNRSIELSIAPKEKLVFKSGIRKNKCRSYDLKGECQYGENCIYSHETLDIRLASLYSTNEIKMPIPPNPLYVYYYFNFINMNRLAECIRRGHFYIPDRHIEKLNEAYDASGGCVYIFVSSLNSKLIHRKGLCLMKESAEAGEEVSKPFRVEWLKVVHMPFMLFDSDDRPVKLDKMEDGTLIDRDTGDMLFTWVWRHPNTLLMMRQSVLRKPKPYQWVEPQDAEDVNQFKVDESVIQSCSFIHGGAVLLCMNRSEYGSLYSTGTIMLNASCSELASHMHIGTIVFVLNQSLNRLHGVFQVTSPAVTYVGKAVTESTPCIYMESRWWHHFASLSLRSIPFNIPDGKNRFLSRKMTLAIMQCFFEKNGVVPYPTMLKLPPQVQPPNSCSISIDINSDGFDFGEHIRNHPIYKRLTQNDGWCYVELLGAGSLAKDATWVKPSSDQLSICFYTCDGLHYKLVENEITRMSKEINEAYLEWCEQNRKSNSCFVC